jgi:hypothetical protein
MEQRQSTKRKMVLSSFFEVSDNLPKRQKSDTGAVLLASMSALTSVKIGESTLDWSYLDFRDHHIPFEKFDDSLTHVTVFNVSAHTYILKMNAFETCLSFLIVGHPFLPSNIISVN